MEKPFIESYGISIVCMPKTVMAFGSFDIIHPGHMFYLQKAKALGDRLIVVIARDRSIELMKGRKPVFLERDRLKIVGSLGFVDKAVLGNRISDPAGRMKIIKEYRPDVIALGYNQSANVRQLRAWLRKNGINARVVRIKARLNPARYKSSVARRILSKGI